MMDIPYRDFAHSQPFQFLVGPEERCFYIHAGLVEQYSKTLAVLVSGGMSEAEERCAKLEDIDQDTFLRFVEFAYTGNYTVADPKSGSVTTDDGLPEDGPAEELAVEEPAVEEPAVEEPAAEEPPEVYPAYQPGFWIEELHESKPRLEFVRKVQLRQTPAWRPRANIRPDEDHWPVFLCHASLYVFSDRYSIEPLQELVLQKLQLTLSRFTLFPERAGDIVELLKYSYANTMDHDHGIDKLRDLVTDYIACKIKTIGINPDFLEYLKEEGFAAKDLMVKLVEQIEPLVSAPEDRYM